MYEALVTGSWQEKSKNLIQLRVKGNILPSSGDEFGDGVNSWRIIAREAVYPPFIVVSVTFATGDKKLPAKETAVNYIYPVDPGTELPMVIPDGNIEAVKNVEKEIVEEKFFNKLTESQHFFLKNPPPEDSLFVVGTCKVQGRFVGADVYGKLKFKLNDVLVSDSGSWRCTGIGTFNPPVNDDYSFVCLKSIDGLKELPDPGEFLTFQKDESSKNKTKEEVQETK